MDIAQFANLLCMGCMKVRNINEKCTFCSFDEKGYTSAVHHLPIRTILAGKYIVGRVLGEGGFGITYLGWDLNLDIKVAIKEYYPTGLVTRENSSSISVTPYIGEKERIYKKEREKFVGEAKSLARFYTLPGIVSVKDFFEENGTAYIVMEFVEGETLKQLLWNAGGRLPVPQILEMMRPLMKSLSEVHKAGIIHRDISPDNIMVTNEGNIKLLDFGAAREYSESGNKSISVMLKPGFAPEEQYRNRGVQGPWSDVYALCATIYRAITGVVPDEAIERVNNDDVKFPSQLGVEIEQHLEAVIMKGMAVLQKNRYQNVEDLAAELYVQAPAQKVDLKDAQYIRQEQVAYEPALAPNSLNQRHSDMPKKQKGAPKRMKVYISGAIGALVVIGIMIGILINNPVKKQSKTPENSVSYVLNQTDISTQQPTPTVKQEHSSHKPVITPTASKPSIVHIVDPNLELGIKEQLGISGDITQDQADALDKLIIKRGPIRSLSGIEHFTNLHALVIDECYGQGITSRKVFFDNVKNGSKTVNDILDFTPLLKLKQLRSLIIFCNTYTDLSVVGQLTELRQLRLSGQYIGFQPGDPIDDNDAQVDIAKCNPEYLQSLTKLVELDISRNYVRDFSFLSGLTNLKRLNISNNGSKSKPANYTTLGPLQSTLDEINTKTDWSIGNEDINVTQDP